MKYFSLESFGHKLSIDIWLIGSLRLARNKALTDTLLFTSNSATGNPVDKNGIISVGRYLESNLQEVTLQAVAPDLFHLVKSTMEDTITRHDNEQINTILEVTR